MKFALLQEDKMPSKLSVRFSYKIYREINEIDSYNQADISAITKWHDYIDWVKEYLSNRAIAFDYANRHSRFPNGTMFINDFNCGIGCTIKNDKFTKQPYVYVFMFNMKLKEFGLKSPNITENNNTKTQNNMKRKIRLTEGDLHRIIRKCINEALNEGSAETVGDFVSDRAKWLNSPSKKQQLDSDWNDLRDHYPYGNGVDFDYQDSEEARENGEYPFGPIADRHYETPEDVKRWNERMKYNKQADSRRLHRKGSLNRAFDEDNNLSEGKLHKIIRRCVNEELKSKRY